MATTRPGEIRCPTCHRSTPPAAFCTQCGAAIPSDLRARPRGMDRDELQERIRARRSGGEPYRRGAPLEDEGPGYERFEPEEGDALARRDEAAAPGQRVDHFDDTSAPPPLTREPDDWPEADRWERDATAPAAPEQAPEPQQPAFERAGYQAEPHYEEEASYADPYAADYEPDVDDAGYGYGPEAWEREPRSSGRSGAVAIIGFLALGVAALLGGAFLANLFGDGGIAGAPSEAPSATVVATASPTVAPTAEPSVDATPSPDGSPGEGQGPVRFEDGVVFHVAACATSEMGFEGCAQDAETVTGGAVWAWMGFGLTLPGEEQSARASGSDALVLILRTEDGTVIDQQAPRVLGEVPGIECPDTCAGYLFQGYNNLSPGEYEFVLERNGEFADSDTFSVGG